MRAYIIGKGPSLEYLTSDYFEEGIIITINHAILAVEKLRLSNQIYSMQKDGAPLYPNCCPSRECNRCPFDRSVPEQATLLVHKHESIHCMPDYSPRLIFDSKELGLRVNECSALSSIRFAQRLGCDDFIFLCFDSITKQDYYTHIPGRGTIKEVYSDNYRMQAVHMINYLIDNEIKYEFITPKSN